MLGITLGLLSCSPSGTQPEASTETQTKEQSKDSATSINVVSAEAPPASAIIPRNDSPSQLPEPPELVNSAGDVFSLETYSDRLVLLNFWATWCAPCRIEMPDLEELQSEYNEAEFKVIGVAADNANAVASFLQTIKVTYPNYTGDPDQIFAWSEKLGNKIVGVPFTAIIDSSGMVRWKKMGGRISVDEVGPLIKQLLNEN